MKLITRVNPGFHNISLSIKSAQALNTVIQDPKVERFTYLSFTLHLKSGDELDATVRDKTTTCRVEAAYIAQAYGCISYMPKGRVITTNHREI